NIVDLPQEAYNFSRVELLNVSKNRLERLGHQIGQFRRLKILHAYLNCLSHVPDTISNCNQLTELDLSNNNLSSLPGTIGYMKNMKVLNISSNYFEQLPHGIGQMENLKSLNAQNNKLWGVPFTMKNLKSLRSLNLAHNRFNVLPEVICSIRSIRELNLKGNRLVDLPIEMQQLRNLQDLNLSKNKFETMPQSILGIRCLVTLNLSNNQLNHVPYRLSRLTKLRTLLLQDNKILSFSCDCVSLETLNLSDNSMKSLSVEKLVNLKMLNLADNLLEAVPMGLSDATALERLFLQNNRLYYLPPDIALLKRLRTLDLGNTHTHTHNSIKSINSKCSSFRCPRASNHRCHPRHGLQQVVRNRPSQAATVTSTFLRNGGGGGGGPAKKGGHGTAKRNAAQRNTSHTSNNGHLQQHRRSFHAALPDSNIESVSEPEGGGRRRAITPTPMSTSFVGAFGQQSAVMATKVLPLQPSNGNIFMYDPTSYPASLQVASIQDLHQASIIDQLVNSPDSTSDEEDRRPVRTTVSSRSQPAQQHLQNHHQPQPNQKMQNRVDYNLLGVCNEVETLLHENWARPAERWKKLSIRSLRKAKSNQDLRSQTAMDRSPSLPVRTLSQRRGHSVQAQPDVFVITQAGGLFASTFDPAVRIHFPANSVEKAIELHMRVESIDKSLIDELRQVLPAVDNLVTVGHL
uniref:Protein Sur-8 homolog n=1 Tax=Macrostomum lignano TaxID=282301 RepID=A0A1I8I625_9PLAT